MNTYIYGHFHNRAATHMCRAPHIHMFTVCSPGLPHLHTTILHVQIHIHVYTLVSFHTDGCIHEWKSTYVLRHTHAYKYGYT